MTALRALLRRRSAAASLAVLLAYGAVAVLVALGAVASPRASSERVGPSSLPGFGERSPDERLRAADFHLDRVQRALSAREPRAALAELALAELRVRAAPADELRAAAERARGLEARAAELVDGGAPAAEVARALDELEAGVDALFEPLTGAERWRYRLRRALGTDRLGRSIAVRAVASIRPALAVGLVTALFSVAAGGLLGAAAAFYRGWVDRAVVALYTTLSSIPSLVLLIALSYSFAGSPLEPTLVPLYVAFCATFWVVPCRVVRAEVLKLAEADFVQAARAVGFPPAWILARHVLPNTAHLLLVNFALLFVSAVKSEVILSFLGLGVRDGPSWGAMLRDSRDEVQSAFFWQAGAATAFLFLLVAAFHCLTDALQDALDPRRTA